MTQLPSEQTVRVIVDALDFRADNLHMGATPEAVDAMIALGTARLTVLSARIPKPKKARTPPEAPATEPTAEATAEGAPVPPADPS